MLSNACLLPLSNKFYVRNQFGCWKYTLSSLGMETIRRHTCTAKTSSPTQLPNLIIATVSEHSTRRSHFHVISFRRNPDGRRQSNHRNRGRLLCVKIAPPMPGTNTEYSFPPSLVFLYIRTQKLIGWMRKKFESKSNERTSREKCVLSALAGSQRDRKVDS